MYKAYLNGRAEKDHPSFGTGRDWLFDFYIIPLAKR
jgi:hypothetical protein